MVRIRKDNACEALADSKSSNVSYHLGSKNAFALRCKCVLNLKRAPNSIYVKKHSVPHPCVWWALRVMWSSRACQRKSCFLESHERMLDEPMHVRPSVVCLDLETQRLKAYCASRSLPEVLVLSCVQWNQLLLCISLSSYNAQVIWESIWTILMILYPF